MRNQSAWNMYIFRDGRTTKTGASLLNDLAKSLLDIGASHPTQTQLLDALLRAGELECTLADSDSSFSSVLANITDSVASALVAAECGEHSVIAANQLLAELDRVQVPARVSVSTPEGFAYYALHPLGYVDLLPQLKIDSRRAAVIGIRSIGTTLSAVVQAGFTAAGVTASRITLRPTGHPYNRLTELNNAQKNWVEQQCAAGAQFFVVDEGPGMSGSSFLSVGDRLMNEGVERERITFLCSRVPDANSLTARDAASRWPAYRALYVAPNRRLPAHASEFVAGGIWRKRVFGDERNWPASWTQMERLKFLSPDASRLFKFEGFGRFGAEVQGRARAVSDAGFAPTPIGAERGFSIYPIIEGELLAPRDLSREVVSRIAEYCAFRARTFETELDSCLELQKMLRFNFSEEFGKDIDTTLETRRPVIADARMLPHKWLRARNGQMLKIDNAAHGDDHFFPGPTDIAWDLAGAAVEWEMSEEAVQVLCLEYKARSGDDVAERLPAYQLAYAVFRMGYCKMAAEAMSGSAEKHRLEAEYTRYRRMALDSHERAHLRQEVKRLVPGVSHSVGNHVKQWA